MPDQSKSTVAAPIPRIDPDSWEEGEGLHETLLFHFTEPEANTTLRRLGGLLLELALESASVWPHYAEGSTRAELRAALADLRHVQGFLAAVGREHIDSSLDSGDHALSQFAARQSQKLSRLADEIEQALGEGAA